MKIRNRAIVLFIYITIAFHLFGQFGLSFQNREWSNWYIAISDGQKFKYVGAGISGFGIGSQAQFLGDVTGDSRADAVVFFLNDGSWQVASANSDGSKFSQPSVWISGFGKGSDRQYLADVTGDGKPDAVVYYSQAKLWNVAYSTGKSFQPAKNAYSIGVLEESKFLADLNGDERADWVSDLLSGEIALSTGSAFWNKERFSLRTPGYPEPDMIIKEAQELIADVNGDHIMDRVIGVTYLDKARAQEGTFLIDSRALERLDKAEMHYSLVNRLDVMWRQSFRGYSKFLSAVTNALGKELADKYKYLVLESAYQGPGKLILTNWFVAYLSTNTFRSILSRPLEENLSSVKLFMADINGDGKADPIIFYDDTGVWKATTQRRDGDVVPIFTPFISKFGASSDAQFLGDVNGDGLADLIVYSDFRIPIAPQPIAPTVSRPIIKQPVPDKDSVKWEASLTVFNSFSDSISKLRKALRRKDPEAYSVVGDIYDSALALQEKGESQKKDVSKIYFDSLESAANALKKLAEDKSLQGAASYPYRTPKIFQALLPQRNTGAAYNKAIILKGLKAVSRDLELKVEYEFGDKVDVSVYTKRKSLILDGYKIWFSTVFNADDTRKWLLFTTSSSPAKQSLPPGLYQIGLEQGKGEPREIGGRTSDGSMITRQDITVEVP